MRNLQRRFVFQTVIAVPWLALAGHLGCASGNLGSELLERPRQTHLIREGEGAVVRLPQDAPYLIALRSNRESPALGAEAEADAMVQKTGDAGATARVDDGGSASASFQLGHVFENDSERRVALDLRVRCDHELEVSLSPPTSLPDAQVSLRLYVRDRHNRLLRNYSLAQHSTEEGSLSSIERKETRFTVQVGPHESVSVFIAGNVQIETTEGRAARGTIKLSGLEMEAAARPAPPVRTVGDEQG